MLFTWMACFSSSMCCLSAVMYSIGVTGSVNFTGNLRTSRLHKYRNTDVVHLPTIHAMQISIILKANRTTYHCMSQMFIVDWQKTTTPERRGWLKTRQNMHLSGYQAYTTSLVNSLQHLPCMAIGSDSLLTTSHRIFFGLSFKSYSFHFIIHAFSPSHSCPLLKHIHILSTYFATQVLLYNLFLVFLSTH